MDLAFYQGNCCGCVLWLSRWDLCLRHVYRRTQQIVVIPSHAAQLAHAKNATLMTQHAKPLFSMSKRPRYGGELLCHMVAGPRLVVSIIYTTWCNKDSLWHTPCGTHIGSVAPQCQLRRQGMTALVLWCKDPGAYFGFLPAHLYNGEMSRTGAQSTRIAGPTLAPWRSRAR